MDYCQLLFIIIDIITTLPIDKILQLVLFEPDSPETVVLAFRMCVLIITIITSDLVL